MAMNNRIINSRFMNQVSWPTVFVASCFAIGLPYLIRRYGLFSNISGPQDLMNRATDVARDVADRVGVNIPGGQQSTGVSSQPMTH